MIQMWNVGKAKESSGFHLSMGKEGVAQNVTGEILEDELRSEISILESAGCQVGARFTRVTTS